jgi:hypothetical protein
MKIGIGRLLDRTLREEIGFTVQTEIMLKQDEMTGLQVGVLCHMSKSIREGDMMSLSKTWPGHEAIGQVTEVLLIDPGMHLLSNPLRH